jgi:phosphatidylinositol alpha-1,6-mannosyltransferase
MIIITTQCFPPKLGGIENLMGGLAQSLASAGRQVKVFADASRDPGHFPSFTVTRYGGFKPLRRFLKARDVTRACRSHGVEGLFADSWKSIERLGKVPVPVSVLAHGMEFPASPRRPRQGASGRHWHGRGVSLPIRPIPPRWSRLISTRHGQDLS